MATNMTIAMCGWMRYRGHRWRPTLEMAAAMYLPFLALFPPLWLGILSPTGLMLYGHLLMLPAMAAAMLLRPAEYTPATTTTPSHRPSGPEQRSQPPGWQAQAGACHHAADNNALTAASRARPPVILGPVVGMLVPLRRARTKRARWLLHRWWAARRPRHRGPVYSVTPAHDQRTIAMPQATR